MNLDLGLDADELSTCVSCGLCLPSCPTWRVTGDEARSPRGRILAMRSVQDEGATPGAAFVEAMDTCVQCRGCEPVCPSSVPFGHLMEDTRAALATAPPSGSRAARAVLRRQLRVLGRPRLLAALTRAGAIAQRLHLVPGRLGLPRLPIRQPPLVPSGTDVWLFTGCVMDAWERSTHVAVKRVLEATGAGVALPGAAGACCGALAVHAGFRADARGLATRVMSSMPGDAPILVDSAGCGAEMKDYGRLLGTPAARDFADRVLDVHEWLAARLDRLPGPEGMPREPVAVQDPCHLRHVQDAHAAVRRVLERYVDVVELDDDGLCCGAGGAFSALQPALATEVRALKVASIRRSGVARVASANPGCVLHLRAGGVEVRHPLEYVAERLPTDEIA